MFYHIRLKFNIGYYTSMVSKNERRLLPMIFQTMPQLPELNISLKTAIWNYACCPCLVSMYNCFRLSSTSLLPLPLWTLSALLLASLLPLGHLKQKCFNISSKQIWGPIINGFYPCKLLNLWPNLHPNSSWIFLTAQQKSWIWPALSFSFLNHDTA